MIRPATSTDLPALGAIEDAAAETFRGTAMEFVLSLPHPAPAAAIPPGVRIWVACGPDAAPVGFLEADIRAGWLHVLELSVHPAAQRRGHAAALMEQARAHAQGEGLAMLSLTTDRLLPWNGPMYQRMGFAELAPDVAPDWLRSILRHEISLGFDPARRIAMARSP